jgi:hypothetical protein
MNFRFKVTNVSVEEDASCSLFGFFEEGAESEGIALIEGSQPARTVTIVSRALINRRRLSDRRIELLSLAPLTFNVKELENAVLVGPVPSKEFGK